MKTIFAVCLLLKTINTYAFLSYYPQSSLKIINNSQVTSEQIREELYKLTAKVHVLNPGKEDSLAENCPLNRKCLTQRMDLTYEEARKIMFGDLFLKTKGRNKFSILSLIKRLIIPLDFF